jgi:hypothetical protein
MKYLDMKRVTARSFKDLPRKGQTRSGYGRNLPSQHMLQIDGKRWHRVYFVQYSNSGTAFIREKNEKVYIATGEL